MATLEQLAEGIRRANAMGNTDAVKKLGIAYRQMQAAASDPAAVQTDPGFNPYDTGAKRLTGTPQQPFDLAKWGGEVAGRIGDASGAFQQGANQGMTMGFGDELYAGLSALPRAGYNMLSGQAKDFDIGRGWQEGLDSARGFTRDQIAKNPTAGMLGDLTGSLVTGGTLAKGGLTLMNGASTIPKMALAGGLEGAAYGGASGFGRSEGDLGQRIKDAKTGALWGAGTGAVAGMISGILGKIGGNKAVDSLDDLEAAGTAKYEQARASGVVADQRATTDLRDTIRKIADKEGLISPTGRLDTSRPAVAEVVRTLDDYAQGTMTVPQMQAMKRKLMDAAGSSEPGEQRIAMQMMDEFNKFTSNLAPQLREGDAIWQRLWNGKRIQKAILLAEAKAPTYGNGGMELALQREFKNLKVQIVNGDIKGLTQAEIDAITMVADGNIPTKIARWLGKFAPTGVVSAGIAGGVPFTIGSALSGGNPVAGAVAAGTVMGTGIASRELAKILTGSAANTAGAVARNAGTVLPQLTAAQMATLRAIIAGGGNLAGNLPQIGRR